MAPLFLATGTRIENWVRFAKNYFLPDRFIFPVNLTPMPSVPSESRNRIPARSKAC